MEKKILVSLILFNYFIIIVVGIAGNKCDMFDKEAVTEEEAKQFAQEIGAQFKTTSAFKNTGIDELFRAVGCKFLDPNYQQVIHHDTPQNNIKITKDDQTKKKQKKRC